MKISVFHIYFFLLFLFLLLAVLLVVVTSVFFYNASVQQSIENRIDTLKTLSETIGSPFWARWELVHIPGVTENFLRHTARTEDILFIRIVNPETRVIEKSSNLVEVGKTVSTLPSFRKQVIIQDGVLEEEAIKEFTLISKSGDHLWMGVSFQEVKRPILLQAFLLGVGLLFLALVGGFLIFFLFFKFIFVPLDILQSAFHRLEQEDYNFTLPPTRTAEMHHVYQSFQKATEKLKHVREREQTISQLKSEFLTITAHQMRTPLSIIKWILRLALDREFGKLTKAQTEHLEKAYQTNERMILLIRDLLDVVRIEEGKFGYIFEPTDFIPTVTAIFRELKTLADKKDTTMILYSPAKALPKIRLDKTKFQLALHNILSNAILYTPSGGKIDLHITLQDEKSLLLCIEDSGIGIPNKDLPRLFEKFFRGKNALKIETAGSGLGLYIAKNIIEAHKGKIWIESTEGKGTTVYITLPVFRT